MNADSVEGGAGASSSSHKVGKNQKKQTPTRTRKRSLFGKASKPSLPTEPLPSPRQIAAPAKTSAYHESEQADDDRNRTNVPSSPRVAASQWQDRIASTNSTQSSRYSTTSTEQGHSPWYQRGLFSKQNESRNRSPSISGSIASSRKPSLTEDADGTEQEGGLRSPSRIRRTFSRRSVYSIQQEDENDRTWQDSESRSDSLQDGASKPEKKKWYSRQTDVGPTIISSQTTQDISGTSPQTRKEGFLQRARSRSIFRGNDASASTESLNSIVSNGVPRQTKKGIAVPRPTSQMDAAQTADGYPAITEGRAELTTTQGVAVQTSTSAQPSGSIDSNSSIDNGLPKRLSGWFLNMLGTETATSPTTGRQMLDPNDALAKGALRSKSSNASIPRTLSKERSTESGMLATNEVQRTAKGGMLAGLAASGRSKVEQATTSNGNFARSGFDRALRYFIDNHEQDVDADEGVWLLGVWHGPVGGANDEALHGVSTADQLEGESKGTGSSVRDSDHGLDDDSSNASVAARMVKRAPSSITSAASVGSGVINKARDDKTTDVVQSGDGLNLAHNPPTPHVSPMQGSGVSRPALSARGQSNTGASKLLSAMAVGAEKTHTFQSDFSTRIWCTYRSHFTPISRDGSISQDAENAAAMQASVDDAELSYEDVTRGSPRLDALMIAEGSAQRSTFAADPALSTAGQGGLSAAFGITSSVSTTGVGGLGEKMGIPNLWSRAAAAAQAYGLAGRAGLTTDAGWGCMLRTGQSVLANALLNVHLGREWRRIAKPLPARLAPSSKEAPSSHAAWRQEQEQFAKYTRLLSWFMDEPSQACPFGVHRMAREGKRLGKEVGEWFGPSTAAGAIKKLVDDYPKCGLGVNVASDGVVYLNQIRALSMQKAKKGGGASEAGQSNAKWTRPVLVLIGVRLGLEGVHPMYHDSVKATFSFTQSVGIAGGRPSSSYYFVGYQGNSLFYLDPHQVRPSVPFKHPPRSLVESDEWWAQSYAESDLATFHNDKPRRMPMKSLDPSMLLGFLITDEESLIDFVKRVKELPKPIFSVQESMPKWMTDDESMDGMDEEEERAIESISEGSFDVEDGENRRSKDDDTGKLDTSEVNTVVGVTAQSPEREDAVAASSSPDNDIGRPQEHDTNHSEGTFELIDRHSTTTTTTSPIGPISFPSKGDEEEEEVLVEHTAEQSFDDSHDFDTTEADLIASPSGRNIDQEADSTWEDLQNDLHQPHVKPFTTSTVRTPT